MATQLGVNPTQDPLIPFRPLTGTKTGTTAVAGLDTLRPIASIPKTILQETARSGAAVALTADRIASKLTGVRPLVPGGKFALPSDVTKFEKVMFKTLFGDRPLRDIKGVGEETLTAFGADPNKVGKNQYALPLGLGLVALDFTTGGKSKATIKTLKKGKETVSAIKGGFRDSVANLLKKAIPAVQEAVNTGKSSIDDWADLVAMGKKIEQGVDTAEDLRKTTELLKLKGFDVSKVAKDKSIQELAFEAAEKAGKTSEALTEARFQTALQAGKVDEAKKLMDSLPDGSKYKKTLSDQFAKMAKDPQAGFAKIPTKVEIQEAVRDVRTQLVDRFAPLQDFVKKGGEKLTANSDPYIAARNFAGHFGKIQNRLDNLSEILVPVRKEMNDLIELGKLDRFEELAKRGITKFEEGMKAADISPKKLELIKKFGAEKTARLNETLVKLRGYTGELLQQARNSGIISEDVYQTIVKNNQRYIPLQRLAYLSEQADNIPRGKNTFSVASQDIIKTIKGSEKEVANPIESIVRNTYRTVALVERNKVAQKVADLANLDEFKDWVKPLTGELESGFEKLSLFRNGVKEEFAIPKEIADVLKGLNTQSTDVMTKMASLSSRALRAGATTFNIPFLASNAIRDFQTATVVSKVGFNPMDWVHGFVSVLKKDDLYRSYLESGASFSGWFEQNKSLATTVKEISSRKSLKLAKTILNPFELIRTAAEKVELAPRIGVYRKALNKGLTPEAAAFVSRNATVDFSRMGSVMKVFNQWTPFINARLQGTINVLTAIKNNPAKVGAIVTGMIGIPVTGTYLHNTRNFKEVWNDIAQFDKDNNFIVIYGDAKDEDGNYTQVVKVPKGDIGRMFGNPLENFLTWVDKNDPKSIGTLITQIFSDLSPVSFEREGKLSGSTLLGSTLPPTIKAFVESVTNMNLFTGRPIVPERLEKASPELQFKENTSPQLIMAGRFLGVSPLLLENFIGTQFGGLGRQLASIQTAPQQISGRFGRAFGRELERKDFDKLNEVEQTVVDKTISIRHKAEALFLELKDIEPTKRQELIRQLFAKQEIDVEVIKELGNVLKRELSDLTAFEESMKNRSTETRAKFIVEKLQSLPVEDRQRLFIEWTEKKIITEEVAKQIIEELKALQE